MKGLRRSIILQKSVALVFFLLFTVVATLLNDFAVVEALVDTPAVVLGLTAAEEEYIAENPKFIVLMVGGAAPIQYAAENGEARGISKLVLEEIAALTGLSFEYQVFDSLAELAMVAGDGDIVMGIPTGFENVLPGQMLSKPYLKSITVQYQRTSMASDNLGDRIYAGVQGSNLPPNILEENVRYFATREEAIAAVSKGDADYGYANAYSVAYYTLKHRYKNLISIPIEREYREYCVAPINPDARLLSILNKAIGTLEDDAMHAIILNATSDIDQDLTLGMFLDRYEGLAWAVVLIIISLLLLWSFARSFNHRQTELQNQRYEILAALANEFFFSYYPQNDTLKLSQSSKEFFSSCPEDIAEAIKAYLFNRRGHAKNTLQTITCSLGVFRVATKSIYDSQGNLQEIIGKLTNVSVETAEKEALVTRAQIDGLTGVFNAATLRELVEEQLQAKSPDSLDAFLLLDADSFKAINDNLGHYTGDQVLKNIAGALKRVFRSSDIVGRIGGDEFCVYVKDIPSSDFIIGRSKHLVAATSYTLEGIEVSVCVGVRLVTDRLSYAEVFQAADAALYQAKAKGKGQVVIAE